MNKEEGSRTTKKERKATIGCFGALCKKEGKTSWRSPEKVGQVDLGFQTPRVLGIQGFGHLGFGLRMSMNDCNV